MRLSSLELTDHRNIAHAVLHPDPHLTVLCGPNGQGKTNLLEAIWLLTGGKSFRGEKITGSLSFADAALKCGIALVPGIAFGDDNCIRLSYAISIEDIKEGLRRLKEFIGELK